MMVWLSALMAVIAGRSKVHILDHLTYMDWTPAPLACLLRVCMLWGIEAWHAERHSGHDAALGMRR